MPQLATTRICWHALPFNHVVSWPCRSWLPRGQLSMQQLSTSWSVEHAAAGSHVNSGHTAASYLVIKWLALSCNLVVSWACVLSHPRGQAGRRFLDT